MRLCTLNPVRATTAHFIAPSRAMCDGGNKMFPLGWEMSDFDDRFDDAGWVANRWAELLPIRAAQKQSLLEETDPLARLKKIESILQ